LTETPVALPTQNILRGVCYMLGAAALFSVMNALVKVLSADFSTPQIIWARNIGHLLFVAALFAPRLGLRLFVSRQPKVQIARSLLQLGSTVCYFLRRSPCLCSARRWAGGAGRRWRSASPARSSSSGRAAD
jgi:hypothetical protein